MQWDIVFGIRIPVISRHLSTAIESEKLLLKVGTSYRSFEMANWRIIDGDGNLLIVECDIIDKNEKPTTTQFDYYSQQGDMQCRVEFSLSSLSAGDYKNCYKVMGIKNTAIPVMERALLEDQITNYLKDNSGKFAIIIHDINHQLIDELKESWYTPKDSVLRLSVGKASFSMSYLSLHINVETKERSESFFFPTEQASLDNDFVYYVSECVVMKYFYLPQFNKLGQQRTGSVHQTAYAQSVIHTLPNIWYHMSSNGENNSTPLFMYSAESSAITNQHTMVYEDEKYFGFYSKTGEKLTERPISATELLGLPGFQSPHYKIFDYMTSDKGDYSLSFEKDQLRLTIQQKGDMENHGLLYDVGYGNTFVHLDQIIKIKADLGADGLLKFQIDKRGEPRYSYRIGAELMEGIISNILDIYNSKETMVILFFVDIKTFIFVYLSSILLRIAQHELSENDYLSPKHIDTFLEKIVKLPTGLKTKAARFELNYGFVVSGKLVHS